MTGLHMVPIGTPAREFAQCRLLTVQEGAEVFGQIRYPTVAPEQLALLGTAPDEESAERLGRTTGAVQQRRSALGIPTFLDRCRQT